MFGAGSVEVLLACHAPGHDELAALLTRRPTVVLRTVDHKLTSAFHWFDDVHFVRFAESPSDVPRLLEDVMRSTDFSTPDWRAEYFDRILEQVEEDTPESIIAT